MIGVKRLRKEEPSMDLLQLQNPASPLPIRVTSFPPDRLWVIIGALASAAATIASCVMVGFTWGLARATRVLADETRRMADQTQALTGKTQKSIALSAELIEAEERRHREGLQPHIAVQSKALWEQGRFVGYSVYLQNIGPGHATNLVLSKITVGPDDSVRRSISTKRGRTRQEGPDDSEPPTIKIEPGEIREQGAVVHSTFPAALISGADYEIAKLADNDQFVNAFTVTYKDAFGQLFRTSVKGIYQPGNFYDYQYEREP
jgi:hypothetical protein